MAKLSDFVVLSNGRVDVDASVAKFRSALEAQAASQETIGGRVATAVSAVFDSHLGKVLTMPVLSTFAFMELGGNTAEYNDIVEAVANHVRNNPEFQIVKGAGGGVSRVCDCATDAK